MVPAFGPAGIILFVTAALLGLPRRVALLGCRREDSPEILVQKQTLTVAAATVTLLATAWTVTYLALGRPDAAAIPLAYQVVSVISLAVFGRTARFAPFRASQLAMMLVLPFLLQWVLGGFEASSVVSAWALVTAFGAVYFLDARRAIPWFAAFVGLTLVSALIDPGVAAAREPLPGEVRLVFFTLNVVGVSVTLYLLLQYFVRRLAAAQAAADALLLNILPGPIAERLKDRHQVIAEAHPDVTVLFADIVEFTPFAERTDPRDVVGLLDEVFSAFDGLAEEHGLEKIKTIGDAYMVVGGLPSPRPDHAESVAEMALAMIELTDAWTAAGRPIRLRIGIDSGPVIAGVIGRRKFSYDLWGDTVNTASRMESHGEPGRIQLSPRAAARLADRYVIETRETIPVKGKGWITPGFLVGRRDGTGGVQPSSGSAASSGRTATAS